jgi:hypothetical protein
MADDSIPRSYRSNDPYRRSAEPPSNDPSAAGDPLAELARLIGQNDPFAEFGRAPSRADESRDPQYDDLPPPPTPAEMRRRLEMHQFDQARPDPGTAPDVSFGRTPVPHADHDPYQDVPERGFVAQDTLADAHGSDPHRFHRDEPVDPNAQYADEDQYYQDDAHLAQGDEAYDEPPRRRRGVVWSVAALVFCAMLGTAGAYAYRTYYVKPDGAKAPPVIVAEKAPKKIEAAPSKPAAAAGEQQPKTIQDRVSAPDERVVQRKEEPVPLNDPQGNAQPRIVYPNLVNTNNGTPPAQAAATTPPSTAPAATRPNAVPTPPVPAKAPAGSSEPKRVRTLTIRPDAPPAPAPRPTPPSTRAAAPLELADGASASPGTRPGAAPRMVNGPTRVANAPLSLAPDTRGDARAAEFPPTRNRVTAAPSGPTQLTPSTPSPARNRVASVPGTPAQRAPAAPATRAARNGGYAVQVASQRSESDAQASFRALQAQYPNVLTGQSHFVRRADLGSRGVYYRAMVGPFGSAGDANRFCSNLKAAGGSCIIQRN